MSGRDGRADPAPGLEGAVALVTGAGSGIGRATARRLAASGVRVGAVDVMGESADRVAAEIRADGGQAQAVGADVSDDADVQAAVREVVQAFGGLDILVNNAGVDAVAPLVETSEEDWDRLFRINAKGVFLCSRAANPHLISSSRAAIVNVASIVALIGVPGYAAYSATKGAVLSLTRAMAVEFAPHGIRVNAVCPGFTRTNMGEAMLARRGDGDAERGAQLTAQRYPLGRIGTPEEIAEAIAFLAGPASAFTTGTALTVDGGMTAL